MPSPQLAWRDDLSDVIGGNVPRPDYLRYLSVRKFPLLVWCSVFFPRAIGL